MAATDALSTKQFPAVEKPKSYADKVLEQWNTHPETDPLRGSTKGYNLGNQ